MRIVLLLFILSAVETIAQPLYTPLRAGVTFEAWGIAPVAMISAEAPILYQKKSFWNIQAGIGKTGKPPLFVPSLASALTYNVILNPYHRNLCNPIPGYSAFECYLEVGSGFTLLQASYGGLPHKLKKEEKNLAAAALLGLRFHLVKERWIYLFKIRLVPFLDSKFSPWGGCQIGLGWR